MVDEEHRGIPLLKPLKEMRWRKTFRRQAGLSSYLLYFTLVKKDQGKDAVVLKSNSEWRKSKALFSQLGVVM